MTSAAPTVELDRWWCGRRVCVTGASGMIGRALIDRLASCATIVAVSRQDRDDYPDGVEARRADLCDDVALGSAVASCSVVFHLAAHKNRHATLDELEAVNVGGTRRLLEFCEAAAVKTVIYASTAYVYGRQQSAVRETDSVTPVSPYASTKREGECLLADHVRRTRSGGLIARIANVYDADAKSDTVIGRGLSQACGPSLVFQDLSPVRDFIHARDVAEALARLAPHANGACPIVNVGTGVGTSIRDVAEVIAGWAALRGKRPSIDTDRTNSGRHIDRLVLDNTRLRQSTAWQPTTSVARGVSEALNLLHPSPLL